MEIELLSFEKPTIQQYFDLLNSPSVQRHMPLSAKSYSRTWVSNWIVSKSRTWPEKSSGPWSVWIEGEFAGWAGVEPSSGELSFGIVLLKSFWGSGARVIEFTLSRIRKEFPEHGSVLIELPISRRSDLYANRLGLQKIGIMELSGQQFVSYRKYFSDIN